MSAEIQIQYVSTPVIYKGTCGAFHVDHGTWVGAYRVLPNGRWKILMYGAS